MNQLYLECYSGISGDMTAAALIDLGVDQEVLKKTLETLPLEGFRVEITRVKKAGLDACDFHVILDSQYENHDHDMEYLFGRQEEIHDHEHHHHDHDHGGHDHHDHDHHDHDHSHDHHHVHRGMAEVREIITRSKLTPGAKEIAMKIFTVLGKAEAKAHGTTLEEVHFHEVGAVDSIVDIAAVAICLDQLKIDQVIIPVLWEGSGTVRCQHGILPIPVPAVANIVADSGLKLHITGEMGEFVTPTGAAIAAAVQTSSQLPAAYEIRRIGLGAGKRNYSRPSILRAMLIEESGQESTLQDQICRMETNIDDCTGEMLGYVMERLFEAGARDVSYMPIYMKKNRPAYQLNVICGLEDVKTMEEIIFANTTTIGIRRVNMERSVLRRREVVVETSLGPARVKVCQIPGSQGEQARIYPEYESVCQLCRHHGLSYREVYQLIERESHGKL